MTPYRYRCLQDPHCTNEETEAEKGQVTGIKVKKLGIKATLGTNGEAGLRIQALGPDPASLGFMSITSWTCARRHFSDLKVHFKLASYLSNKYLLAASS